MENNQSKSLTTKPADNFYPTLPTVSFKDIVKLNLTSIVRMKKEGQIEQVQAILILTINEVFKFYNETIIPENQKTLCKTVIDKGYMLNGADLQLFKKKCISGDYPLKFRLTPPVFLEWLEHYIFERGEEFAKLNQKKEVSVSENELKLAKLFAEKLSKPKQEIKEPSRQDKAKEFINQVHNEFKDKAENIGGVMFIDFNGKKLNFDEYLKARTK